MPEIERDGEELPRLSPGVGCDSTAQGDKVICQSNMHLFQSHTIYYKKKNRIFVILNVY